MKYYKELKDNVLIAYGITDRDILAENCTEITEAEYDAIVAQVAADDKARAEAAEKAAEEARKKAEEEAAAHKAAVDDYVAKVKAGTIKIADVPGEYRAEVDSIVNPFPTVSELQTQLTAAQSAIDFLILNGSTEV